jgi:hypothetical protein
MTSGIHLIVPQKISKQCDDAQNSVMMDVKKRGTNDALLEIAIILVDTLNVIITFCQDRDKQIDISGKNHP